MPLVVIVILSVLLNIVLEALARRSFSSSLLYIVQSPGAFFFNALVILLTLSGALFFRRRLFFITAISVIWLTLGVTNCALLGFRTTPFSAADLRLITTALDVFDLYLSWWQTVLIAIGAVAIIIGLVFMWRKVPKYTGKNHLVRGFATVCAVTLCVFGANSYMASAQETSFTNLADAYENYGFAYCFSVSLVDTGIGKPGGYNQEAISEITDSLPEDTQAASTPNVVYVQLESFFDITYWKGLEFSEDPIPVFRSLKENYTSGLLYVPAVGAGTANTEFEVLTGISIDFFGTGEYPYKTVLQDATSRVLLTIFPDWDIAHTLSTTTGVRFTTGIRCMQIWALIPSHRWNTCKTSLKRKRTGLRTRF